MKAIVVPVLLMIAAAPVFSGRRGSPFGEDGCASRRHSVV
jgi:hypothetical protein